MPPFPLVEPSTTNVAHGVAAEEGRHPPHLAEAGGAWTCRSSRASAAGTYLPRNIRPVAPDTRKCHRTIPARQCMFICTGGADRRARAVIAPLRNGKPLKTAPAGAMARTIGRAGVEISESGTLAATVRSPAPPVRARRERVHRASRVETNPHRCRYALPCRAMDALRETAWPTSWH